MNKDTGIWSSEYKLAMPLCITLDNGKSPECKKVVRSMPSRRYVCQGSYEGKDVYIKLFSKTNKAVREWHAEQAGIDALNSAKVAAPTILFSGSLKDNSSLVIIYAELPNAQSAQARCTSSKELICNEVISDLVNVVAAHHSAGLMHTDLHLLNFIYSDKQLYTLDAGDIKKVTASLTGKKSLSGLADLLALFPVEIDESISEWYAQYSKARNTSVATEEIEVLKKQVTQKRKYKLRKYLEKVFRTCSAFVAFKSNKKYFVYDRLLETNALSALLASNDDNATPSGHVLKDGNTCTVYEFEQDGRLLVCKRYNIKNIFHALSRAFRPSRAAYSWKNAHHLLNRGIATARPVALYEQRLGPLRRRAWLYMEKVDGAVPYEALMQGAQESASIVQDFSRLFEKMAREKISHGDMKITNFIYSKNILHVIDLDSMHSHQKQSCFAKSFSRDMRRFLKNWQSNPVLLNTFRKEFSKTCVAEYLPSE